MGVILTLLVLFITQSIAETSDSGSDDSVAYDAIKDNTGEIADDLQDIVKGVNRVQIGGIVVAVLASIIGTVFIVKTYVIPIIMQKLLKNAAKDAATDFLKKVD